MNLSATRFAAALAFANPATEGNAATDDAPRATSKPAKCQPMVPFSKAAMGLRSPALINDWAPMMLRVRPAQLTTIGVSGSGAMSWAR